MDKIKKPLDILATVSHEIRTPLNAIIGMAQILNDKNLTPEQQQCVDTIQVSGQHLLALVNDVLDYAKLEAHKLDIKQIPLDIKKLIDQSCQIFQHKLLEKHIDLIVEYQGAIPPYMLGDEMRIRQILLNLLSNAIKFTEKGQIKIIVEAQSQTIKITVADTGVGIAKKHLEMIFERFVQVHPQNNYLEGTGLGLAIVKSLVEAMQGQVGVTSHLGEGSQFWFSLPLTVCNDPVRAPTFIRNYSPRVLVVEDNKLNQQVITLMLNQLGCKIDIAHQGTRALELFEQNHYPIIFMDIGLPGMDGFETIRSIRRVKNKHKKVAIIALTAHATEENFNNCINSGADDVLTKPILKDDLIKILDKYCPKE